MKISHTIKLDTYGCQVIFIVTDEMKIQCEKLSKRYNIKLENEDSFDSSEGLVISPNISKYFVFIDINYLSHNTIAHELHHVVVKVTEERDIIDEEARAWLVGHISGSIYKFLDKKKLQIKHG